MVNRRLFNNRFTKVMNIMSVIIILVTVVGRLISGVHWFTDIVGGIVISAALLMTFYLILGIIKKEG